MDNHNLYRTVRSFTADLEERVMRIPGFAEDRLDARDRGVSTPVRRAIGLSMISAKFDAIRAEINWSDADDSRSDR